MENNIKPTTADEIREECFTTKSDLLEWLNKARSRIKKRSETDINHSAAFYHVYDELLVKFMLNIKNTILFKRLEDFWHYTITISDSGAVLYLDHYRHDNPETYINYNSDQSFKLLHVKTKMLTVEQYANTYGVTPGTVRQWIRRGKIRNAIKVGSEWRIPELTEVPGRGYQSGLFMWHEILSGIPEEYEFLNNYTSAMFDQDKDSKEFFNISFKVRGEPTKVLRVNTKEREKIELFMITHPQIHNIGLPDDGLNLRIVKKAETGFFYEDGKQIKDFEWEGE